MKMLKSKEDKRREKFGEIEWKRKRLLESRRKELETVELEELKKQFSLPTGSSRPASFMPIRPIQSITPPPPTHDINDRLKKITDRLELGLNRAEKAKTEVSLRASRLLGRDPSYIKMRNEDISNKYIHQLTCNIAEKIETKRLTMQQKRTSSRERVNQLNTPNRNKSEEIKRVNERNLRRKQEVLTERDQSLSRRMDRLKQQKELMLSVSSEKNKIKKLNQEEKLKENALLKQKRIKNRTKLQDVSSVQISKMKISPILQDELIATKLHSNTLIARLRSKIVLKFNNKVKITK